MKYLLWCANVHINFRFPELKAIASCYKIPVTWIENRINDPYVVIEVEKAADAEKLVSRSLLVRACYEIWGEGTNMEELHCNVKKNLPLIRNNISKAQEFKFEVITYNKKISGKEKLKKIESFSYLPFKGKVNLSNPELVVSLFEFYGLSPTDVPENPFKIFLGRWLLDGQRDIIDDYSLKKRKFIGNTSMDAELAFLMANMAQVGEGDIVVDPFVGTGSILVSAARKGAYVWGWDIDFLTLHAKTKPSRCKEKIRHQNESIKANLEQYNLGSKYLDVLVMDSSKNFWRKENLIDAIITDPPYGIRESTERVGYKEKKRKLSSEDLKKLIIDKQLIHYPEKTNYSIADIMVDLLNFAVAHLKIGGRLVFWLPVFREDYSEKLIPHHPCLRLEFNSEQVLNTHSSRRLVTLVKSKEAEDGETAVADELQSHDEFRRKFLQASQSFQNLSKDEKKALKKKFPNDKKGRGYVMTNCINESTNGTAAACTVSELNQVSLSSERKNPFFKKLNINR